jgi:signal transduction histidine kinase
VQRQPLAIDAVLAAVLLIAGLPTLATSHPPTGSVVGLLLHVAISAPVVFRRTHPVAATLATVVAGLAQLVVGVTPSLTDLSLIVMVYSAVAYGPRWLAALAAVGSLAAPALAIPRWTQLTLDEPRTFAYMYLVLATPFVIGWALGRTARYRAAYLAGVEERAARLEHERDVRASVAVSAERARIARDMHDVVAHAVSVMVVQADGAAYALDGHPEQSRHALATIADTGRQTLAELRRVLGVLRGGDDPSGYLPQPGVAQLTELVAQVRSAGLSADLVLEGVPVELSAGGQLAVYRIVQEALTNAVKHGGPAVKAQVLLRYRPDTIEVEVTDDGRGAGADGADDGRGAGADEAGEARKGGHGLVGMRERVALFDGVMTVGPRTGGGFRVWIRLPVAALRPVLA